MENEQLSGSRSWFADEQESTGSATDIAWSSIVAMVFIAGTGGLSQDIGLYRRFATNDLPFNPALPVVEQTVPTMILPQPKAHIDRIRAAFSPAMSDLAMALGVSRQAVYNWINGNAIDDNHLMKLNDLSLAADIVMRSGVPMTGWLLNRKIFNGKSMMEAVREGASAQDLARRLVQFANLELEQRSRLNARLGKRARTHRSPESDFPAENDGEA